ncbi:hypothetical protein [Paenibacillus hexagrammi]|uniref:Uncharacterized protein n=1 Tax=Paenibacillus hexagrammi TaxID=2908839 RepID=A0ABY3SHE0_9BACL|nr:hypothetical protein [Paenibacillus sp. YPD9-1]UJF32367.1 hypothetical protein L0M14_22075 [Paenibacillus sp. YPD9-1]
MLRYYYYLILVNMLVSVLIFVPRIMLEHKYSGAIMSIGLGGYSVGYFYTQTAMRWRSFRDRPSPKY